VVHPSGCSTVLRRFAGPAANEFAILCRPDPRSPDTVHQAEAVYRALAALLAAQQATFRDLTCETLFLRDVRRELPLVLGARTRVLADLGQSACAPLPAFIQQRPVDEGASFELSASAVVPRHRDAWSVRDVQAVPSCACEGCTRSGARLVRLGPAIGICPASPLPVGALQSSKSDRLVGDQTSLYTTNVYGAGGDAFEQAWDMFCAAERLLGQCGMGFRDVVRTWIHLRDIDRDYDALNKARREFFRRCSIEQRPASTGVQGIPLPDAHDFSMTLHAVKSPRSLDVTLMSTPSLNEAWSYGVDFSRGLRLAEANKVTLYISGTASIDEAGRTVHVGDFEAQVDRMLDNVASLLAQQGATFENLASGVTYLRNPGDAPVLRSRCHQRGFEGFPCALVQAPLCRPDLLCETEAVAMLPVYAERQR
jgi:enamine deaminase RidA (YjgF/YER057c/UK114 family)